jgi:outer membrane lipoprotein-sorting protein
VIKKQMVPVTNNSFAIPVSNRICRGILNIYIVGLTFLLIGYTSSAEKYSPVKDENAFMRQYGKISGEIKSLEADFVQEKEIVLLTKKLTSQGRLIFGNNNSLKIEYLLPNIFIFSMRDNKVTVKDGERTTSSISVKSNKLFEQISQITMYAINGKIFDSKNFNSVIMENKNSYMIILVPKSKELKQYYKELDVVIGKETMLIEKLIMQETSGDKTTMVFNNIEINNPIADEVFTVN